MALPYAVRALVDDAGLFPPTALAMPDALARHRDDEAAGSPVHSHRMLVPATRVEELLALLPADAPALSLGVIGEIGDLQAALTAIDVDPRVSVGGIEARWPAEGDALAVLADLRAQGRRVPIVVEVPIDEHLRDRLSTLAILALGAKVRCGGVTTEAFPSAEQLERFIREAITAGVPFKATAGLHHAVRSTDPTTGFTHHGFLNILVAVQRLVDGWPLGDALTSTDGPSLAAEVTGASEDVQRATRAMFLGYGSCDTRAPLTDLQALGLA